MGDDTEDRAQQEKQARERITRSVNEFVDEHADTRRVRKVAEDGKYGHPFHDKVAAYIKENNAKLQKEFMQGFHSREQERAMAYLIDQGIINSRTPTARINEFLAAWNIPPLPDQESEDVTIGVGVHAGPITVDVGEATMVTPNQDDEIVDAEIIEDDG